uniref:Uncharacterized protein n=2 Tax=Magallana gigas TaxID=29159 RepID=K1QDU1_MAGGI
MFGTMYNNCRHGSQNYELFQWLYYYGIYFFDLPCFNKCSRHNLSLYQALVDLHTMANDLIRPAVTLYRETDPKIDMMAPVTTMNRIAQVACERIILMMNNTGLVKERRLSSMNQVLTYLIGRHDDIGLSGDRGDLYRRKLAEQIFLAFAINGVDHNNVVVIVESAIQLEQETRRILMGSANTRFSAPGVRIDEQVLNILARIAEIF